MLHEADPTMSTTTGSSVGPWPATRSAVVVGLARMLTNMAVSMNRGSLVSIK